MREIERLKDESDTKDYFNDIVKIAEKFGLEESDIVSGNYDTMISLLDRGEQ